ncbi:hypothetical protein CALVIDRAFT_307663 [Calocera viscosa TUFC12733]|uniref:Serine-threonine/tyrosine-protein kinase catalytic domain-containing protein n=1 Tax=Calocera viscosa (strain TUFC12733) TaxID=1330018 RepID=A0A167ICS4_CALVF|nr:hypothetical protein CALVIDRAFT_307663 [Calocera viscosa TUFC12733]
MPGRGGLPQSQILTGELPFRGKSNNEALLQVLQGANPARPADCYWIDDDRWDLMLECWSKDREARPQLNTLRQDLDQSIWLDHRLRGVEYLDVGWFFGGRAPLRRLLAQRVRIMALEFPLSTTPDSSIHELEGILRQLDIHVLRFSDPRRGTRPEKMEAILQLTPSLQHLELCASALSPAIDCPAFIDVAQKYAPHLTTLILRNVPATFGQLSSLMLRNLEVRMNINQPHYSWQRVLAFWQLLQNTPSLERLIIYDWAATDGVEASHPHVPPQLVRLRCVHLETRSPILASVYLLLVSRSNLTEFSFKLLPERSIRWNIEQLRAWAQLKVLSLPPMEGLNVGIFDALTALEDLECGREDFLDLLPLASQGTVLPTLNTLRIRSVAAWWDGDKSIAGFLRARYDAGIPLQRLLVEDDVVSFFFARERDWRGVDVQFGRYRPRDGFEGVTVALEPVDVLFTEAELKEYGLCNEPKSKGETKPKGRWPFWKV